MSKRERPDWWPPNPYPKKVFPRDLVRLYDELELDDNMRTAISGAAGRIFWRIAQKSIWDHLQKYLDEMEDKCRENTNK